VLYIIAKKYTFLTSFLFLSPFFVSFLLSLFSFFLPLCPRFFVFNLPVFLPVASLPSFVYLFAYSVNTFTLQITCHLAWRTSRWIINRNFILLSKSVSASVF